MDTPAKNLHPRNIVREYVDNLFESLGFSRLDLIQVMEVLEGKDVTPTSAASLEKVFHRPVHFWINIQSAYDHSKKKWRIHATQGQGDVLLKSFKKLKQAIKYVKKHEGEASFRIGNPDGSWYVQRRK